MARRLQHLESELADMTQLLGLFTQDMIALRDALPREAQRALMLAGAIGTLLAIAGCDEGVVGDWLLAIAEDDLDAAAAATGAVMDDLLLRHGATEGEA